MARFDSIPLGERAPHVVNVLVEIPKGSRNKYELDAATGLFRLDRYLYSSSHYPGDYGFLPQTLAADGDALDALVMVNERTFTGCLIAARVLGVFRMQDRGADDFKLLTVPDSDPLFADYHELGDVPQHFLREVEHFFATYKALEEVRVETFGWADAAAARDEVEKAVQRLRQSSVGR